MEQIVLNTELIHIFNALNLEQKGVLLTALMEGNYTGEDELVSHIFCYVMSLQDKIKQKKQRMKELGAKGGVNRWHGDSTAIASLQQRKETKENNNINKKNILNLFAVHNSKTISLAPAEDTFTAPSVAEVKSFIAAEKLKVDAETFVNFYESHGWMVGTTPIKNWQATLKLWHSRALKSAPKSTKKSLAPPDDESYWHELNERVQQIEPATDILAPPKSVSLQRNVGYEQQQQLVIDLNKSPFARFMQRIEKFDLKEEYDHEQKK